ncbi:MAG: hypothetical protein V4459_04285 [Pseudomonadota bacterium]
MKMIFATALAVIAFPAMAQDMPATPPPPPQPQTAPMPPPTPAPVAPVPMAAPAPEAPMASTEPYPMCSKTVTDHCMERSNARGERLHSTPRPRR